MTNTTQHNTQQVHAVADNVKYECGAPADGINFRPTMMFQTRAYSFPLTNHSSANLDFKFQVLSANGTQVGYVCEICLFVFCTRRNHTRAHAK